jgi:alpha-glucosidase
MNDKFLWWQTGVIYQIYPRSFQDSNGDGVGDLAGIIQRLDYLSDTLGVDAIWLSPFYPSPMADFGYDVSNYTGVDPIFGTLADFDRLVVEAHRRNLRVIIDFVPNHTSDQHPWFLESRASRDNPKRDWYVWHDPSPRSREEGRVGALPNNWQSCFGGPAWEWDEKTGQYYLHSFLKEQPDLNWRNPEVKQAMFDVVRFWLERGVDGFRIDVAHYIMKDPEFRDNPYRTDIDIEEYRKKDHLYVAQIHLHDKGHPDVHTVYREFRQLLDAYSVERPRYSVGEIHIDDWNAWASYYGANLDELHMPFNFNLMRAPWSPRSLRHVVDGLEAAIPPGAWPNYVLGNHDEPRIATKYGQEYVRIAAMLLLTLRGTPTLYQGDELGMENVDIPPEKQKDPYGIRVPGKGRDGCRTPMQWSAAPNAGFAPAGAECWLPPASDYPTMNVERQLADPPSVLNLYRRLLAYRRATPALQWGSYRPVDGVPESCYVFLREADGQKVLVALNFAGQPVDLNLSNFGSGEIRLSTTLDREGAVNLAQLNLRPHEGVLVVLK